MEGCSRRGRMILPRLSCLEAGSCRKVAGIVKIVRKDGGCLRAEGSGQRRELFVLSCAASSALLPSGSEFRLSFKIIR